MMKKMSVATCVAVGLLLSGQVFACGIQGTAVNSDGSKINGSGVISTSWNSKKAYPKNGSYSLDLGSSVCGEKITVYLDGNQGQRVTVKGWTTVNFVRP
ncbi:hypothetical protein Paes_2386 (plasmid) [Prosthecochloris aestuarii DSM 271]|uniref:Uncharacterized protein n=1 Tax=Prosthecochloris aestuarii (strain DSM 271 / SK 413) TaxID=290512 RepID=B4S9P9_PROA2|nr:hypothetical protein [Prosthecochloris aestuarii]ACF47376.1 hypothetical protein Paes_2386 [Prosthecochloris aestuarii DSM 271]